MSDNNIISINSKKPIPKITLVNKQEEIPLGMKEFESTIKQVLEDSKKHPIEDFILITIDNKDFSYYRHLSQGLNSGIGMLERVKTKYIAECTDGD